MPFSVEDFHDMIRLLEAHPEWRADLRRLLLSEEFLALPEQLAALRVRSEEQFQALLAADQRLAHLSQVWQLIDGRPTSPETPV